MHATGYIEPDTWYDGHGCMGQRPRARNAPWTMLPKNGRQLFDVLLVENQLEVRCPVVEMHLAIHQELGQSPGS